MAQHAVACWARRVIGKPVHTPGRELGYCKIHQVEGDGGSREDVGEAGKLKKGRYRDTSLSISHLV
jgi:hypothetical protein